MSNVDTKIGDKIGETDFDSVNFTAYERFVDGKLAPHSYAVGGRIFGMQRLIHGAMGAAGEAGEILDAIKKCVFYGGDLDVTNLMEEVGDALFYLQSIATNAGFTIPEAIDANIRKLNARYGDKFSAKRALNRDLEKEREVLEG